jgi:hypothetical protein
MLRERKILPLERRIPANTVHNLIQFNAWHYRPKSQLSQALIKLLGQHIGRYLNLIQLNANPIKKYCLPIL